MSLFTTSGNITIKIPRRGARTEIKILTLTQSTKFIATVDESIGEILKLATDETTVILMSDHGAGGSSDTVIYFNKFLELHGLFQFKRSLGTYINKKIDGLKSFIRFLLPQKWLKKLRFNPKGMGLKFEAKLRYSFIDWANTKVYAEETPYYPNLRINLKGREPEGVVEKRDYTDVVNQTIALLDEWRDPETGNRIVKKAYRKEDLYDGDYIDKAPDIIISWNLDNNYSYLYRPSFVSRKSISIEKMAAKEIEKSDYMLNRSGSHRDEGIFVIAGKKINAKADINNVEIIDIAPTILYILDIPIPIDMDGKVLLNCFEEDYIKTPVFKKVNMSEPEADYHYTDEETDKIKERLKGLGYL